MIRFFCLFLVLLLSACSKENNEEKYLGVLTEVSVDEAIGEKYSSTLKVYGTTKPVSESVISAESFGTVNRINFTEGDFVNAGDFMISLYKKDHNANLDLNQSKKNLSYNIKQFSTLKGQNLSSIELSVLELLNLKNKIKDLEKQKLLTKEMIKKQVDSAQNGIVSNNTSYDGYLKTLDDTKENFSLQEKTLIHKKEELISNSLLSIKSILQSSDIILGFSKENELLNDKFEFALGISEPQTKITAFNSFKKIWSLFLKIEEEGSINNYNIPDLLSELAIALNDLYAMLQKTEYDVNLSVQEIQNFKSQTIANQNTVESLIFSFKSLDNQFDNLENTRNKSIRDIEIMIEQSRNSEGSINKSVDQIIASGDVSLNSIDMQINDLKNNLKVLEKRIQLQKKQNKLSEIQMQSAISNANSIIKKSKSASDNLIVHSPFSGVIAEKYVNEGNLVNSGTPLFKIMNIDNLLVTTDISSDFLGKIKEGTKARVQIEGFSDLDGFISKIYPRLDDFNSKINIEILIKNIDKKIPIGGYVTADIILPEIEGVMFVSMKSFFTKDPYKVLLVKKQSNDFTSNTIINFLNSRDKLSDFLSTFKSLKYRSSASRDQSINSTLQSVFTKKQKYFILQEKEVEIGQEDNGRVEILSGLNEGDFFVKNISIKSIKNEIVKVDFENKK